MGEKEEGIEGKNVLSQTKVMKNEVNHAKTSVLLKVTNGRRL